jgi:hypothetical protein
MEKSDFKELMKSIEQAGRIMKGEKLPGIPRRLKRLGGLNFTSARKSSVKIFGNA